MMRLLHEDKDTEEEPCLSGGEERHEASPWVLKQEYQ